MTEHRVTIEDINVRITARLSGSLTLGLYADPITRRVVAENLAAMLATAEVERVEGFLDSFTIDAVGTDELVFVEAESGAVASIVEEENPFHPESVEGRAWEREQMAHRDDSNVFHIGALDHEFAAAFDPLKPWVFEFDGGQECFGTEDEACARQRAYREGLGFDPMTGEARPHV